MQNLSERSFAPGAAGARCISLHMSLFSPLTPVRIQQPTSAVQIGICVGMNKRAQNKGVSS